MGCGASTAAPGGGAAPAKKGKASGTRYNTLRPSPPDAVFKLAVVQFKVPGAKNGGSDKGPDGNRIDSIPIANGVIAAGGACDLLLYDSSGATAAENTAKFDAEASKYDALIVRINPGQLSQGTPEGTQAAFDDLMNSYISKGKLVWSSPRSRPRWGQGRARQDRQARLRPARHPRVLRRRGAREGLQGVLRLPAACDQAEPRFGRRGHLAVLAREEGRQLARPLQRVPGQDAHAVGRWSLGRD